MLGVFQISSQFSLEGHVIIKAKSWQGQGNFDREDERKGKKIKKEKENMNYC